MFSRRLTEKLRLHLNERQITVITGMRRVGKTTILKMLLEDVPSKNKLYIDLERMENRILFSQKNYKDIELGLQTLGLDFTEKSYLFIDEIQMLPEITSVIKVLYDDFNIKFVVSGSSSFYLKNRFSESLAGRKRIFELYPLTFSEYLEFKDVKLTFKQDKLFPGFNRVIYDQLKKYFEDYQYFGGFPEVVLSDSRETRDELLKDIINSYIELDVKLLSDFSAANDLYRLIQLLSARAGNRIDYSKISSLSAIPRMKVKNYLELLSQTYLIFLIQPFTKNKDREIVSQQKLYIADSGLARIMGCQNSGALFENTVFNQLIGNFNEIRYHANKSGQEIDFILNGEIAVEVKETASEKDMKILTKRSEQIGINTCHLICNNIFNPGFIDFTWAGNILL